MIDNENILLLIVIQDAYLLLVFIISLVFGNNYKMGENHKTQFWTVKFKPICINITMSKPR